LRVQAKVGWGRFLKGFIATDLQSVVDTQKETQTPQHSSKCGGHVK
jgi:hypothetical protein